jgi:hypothetical protein
VVAFKFLCQVTLSFRTDFIGAAWTIVATVTDNAGFHASSAAAVDHSEPVTVVIPIAVENLVVTVGTVGNSVTSPRLRDEEAGVRATEEILVGNRIRGAVGFIGTVPTIIVKVTSIATMDTPPIGTVEFTGLALPL